MKKYGLLLLDADGTLLDYDKAEAIALKNALERCGFDYSEDILLKYRKINVQLWMEFEQGLVDKERLQGERFEKLFQGTGFFTDPAKFNEIYLDYLAAGSFLIEGALDLCRELSTFCTLAIMTNGIYKTQKKRLEGSQIAPYISYLLVSEEAGYQKPHRGFFDYAFRICNHTDKGSAIILGDSLRADIKGGADYGIATCWYNPHRENPESNSVRPDFIIHELAHFLDVMKA